MSNTLEKLTRFVMSFLTRIFSYATSVAFSSLISASITLAFIYFFIKSIKLHIPLEVYYIIIISSIVGFLIQAIQFGILGKLGFIGFTKSVRIVNSFIEADPIIQLKKKLTDQNIKDLLRAFTRLPFNNSINAVFWVMVPYSILLVFLISTHGLKTITEYLVLISMGFISFFIHGGFSLILGELGTGPMRVAVKKQFFKRGIPINQKTHMSIGVKILFFMVIFILGLFISNTLTYYNRDNMNTILIFAGISVLVFMFMAFLIFYGIYDSLKAIERSSEDLRKGGTGILTIKSLDREFINVARGINKASTTILDYQKNLENKVKKRTFELQSANNLLKEKDDIIQRELDFASEIQNGMIPETIPEWNGLHFAVYTKAMEKVSGDYYDIFHLQGNRLGILMADVSGHGIPAALITTMAKISFTTAGSKSHSPSAIFTEVNEQLTKTITTQEYLTAFFISIDEEHRFSYANAAHLYTKIIRKNNQIEELDSDGLFIGALVDTGIPYEEKTNQLYSGDRFVLYTDGITERQNENEKFYGGERFNKMLLENSHLSVNDLVDVIIKDVEKFADGSRSTDDVSLMIIEADEKYGDFLVHFKESIDVFEKGDILKAATLLDDSLLIYGKNLSALKLATKLHLELNNLEKAQKYVEEYIRNSVTNAEVFYLAAKTYFALKKYRKSADNCERAIDLRSNYSEAYYQKALSCIELENQISAIEQIEKAHLYDSDNETYKKLLNKLKS